MEIAFAALGAAVVLTTVAIFLRRKVRLKISTKGIDLQIEPSSEGSPAIGSAWI
jgi:hypothetical protein